MSWSARGAVAAQLHGARMRRYARRRLRSRQERYGVALQTFSRRVLFPSLLVFIAGNRTQAWWWVGAGLLAAGLAAGLVGTEMEQRARRRRDVRDWFPCPFCGIGGDYHYAECPQGQLFIDDEPPRTENEIVQEVDPVTGDLFPPMWAGAHRNDPDAVLIDPETGHVIEEVDPEAVSASPAPCPDCKRPVRMVLGVNVGHYPTCPRRGA